MTLRQLITTGLVLASSVATAAQTPGPTPAASTQVDVQAGVGKTRVDAFFKALASGNPDTFEAMAKEHYAPDLLARRTPADRKQMVERIRADFGQMTLGRIEKSTDGPVTLAVRGATGMQGTIEVTLEAPPAERITRVAIEVGDAGPREGAPPPPDVRATMTPAELAQGLDAYLAPLVASDAFSGVVLVARSGEPVYEKAFGPADRERKTSNTVGTRFNIGSINKMFTKTAVAQLVSQGKLKLSDTLGALLPDYPNAETKPATVDQLLSHQGGVADFFGPAFEQGLERSVPVECRLLSAGRFPAAVVCAGRAAPVLQRVLHRAGRDCREGKWRGLRRLHRTSCLHAGRNDDGRANWATGGCGVHAAGAGR